MHDDDGDDDDDDDDDASDEMWCVMMRMMVRGRNAHAKSSHGDMAGQPCHKIPTEPRNNVQ